MPPLNQANPANLANPAALPFAADDPLAWALLALGAFGVFYMAFLRPRMQKAARRRDPMATRPDQRRSLAGERSAERQMQSLVIELEALARRMGGELDTKAAKLETLIGQADERIARLTAGGATAAAAAKLADGVRAGKSGPAESGLAGLGHHRDLYALADAGQTPAQIAAKVNRPAGEVELILALRGR